MMTMPLPSYPNDEGAVFLLNDSGLTIDHFFYDDEMHFDLIKNTEGVSLERISAHTTTNEITNWHSASEVSGFGTPGLKNSQNSNFLADQARVSLDPLVFSPNNDGTDDVVAINYNFGRAGFVATINIYDVDGRIARRLVNNDLLSVKGTFFWHGIDDEGKKSAVGLYIIYFEAFNLQGKVESFKRVVVLADFLD